MSKETLVNKSETFDEWRLKSNEVSLDLGSVASDATYTATSLDTESRLTDQYITRDNLGDDGLYIRDISNLPGGLEIDFSADRVVDNTDGYLILKEGVTTKFAVGTRVVQYAANSAGSTPLWSATIVSCSPRKLLLSNIGGAYSFNPTLNLYDLEDSSIFIAASRLKEIIVESYNHGNVRVYRTRNYTFNGDRASVSAGTNKVVLSQAAYHAIKEGEAVTYTTPASGGIYGSANDVNVLYVKKNVSATNYTQISFATSPGGNDITLSNGSGMQTLVTPRVALTQDMGRDGFHIAPHKHYVTTNASSIPVTFLEGEVLYQGSAQSPSFKGTLYTADVSGVLIFKNVISGTFNSTVDLISTTVTNGAGTTLSGSSIKIAAANLTSDLVTTNNTIGQMIEFNMPTAQGDDYKVYFGSAVDAVLELQDDVGTIENLQTNNTTDLTVAINELELGIRGTSNNLVATDLASSTGRPAFTANNIVSALVEHEVDLYGTNKSLASLGTTDKGDFVLAINELETAIRGTNTALVSADLVSTASPSAHPAMDATNLIDAVLEHEVDLYGTGSQTLASLGTNDKTDFVSSINELETAIRGTSASLVSTAITNTISPAGNTSLFNNNTTDLLGLLLQHQMDIGDATNAKLGVLNTPNVSLATHSTQIASGATVLTMASNPITAGIKVGMFVTGQSQIDQSAGGGSFVTAVSATQVTISRPTLAAMTGVTLQFKVEDLVTKIKGLDDSLGALSGLTASPFHGDITYSAVTFKDAINSVTAAIGNTDIGAVINSGGNETLTNAIAQLYTDIGDVGAAGVNISGGNYNNSTTDLKSAVLAAATGMTGSVEFDTAFHATGNGSLAQNSGYSATDLHGGIREVQTYLGDPSTLSNSGDTYTVTAAAAMDGTSTTTLLIDSGNTNIDVGYQVAMASGFTAGQIPASTVVVRVNNDAHSSFTLNNAVTVNSNGDTNNILFTEPTGYGFATDVITDALIELRTALVGGTADLTDKINTLDDADGAASDFNVTNVVDAIRELQDDIGQRTLITAGPLHNDINGTYNTTNIVTVLNAITAAIGSSDIGNPATRQIGLETITNAIKQIREDLGNVGPGGRTVTTTGTTSTATMVVNSTANLLVGMKAVHANIAAGTTIDSITNGTTLVLSAAPSSNIATSSTITFENSNLNTAADDVVNAINELEDDLYTSASGSFNGLTSTHFKGAVEELRTELGDVTVLSDADGFTNTTAVGSIQELQIDVGNINPSNMGNNTDRPKTLQSAVSNSTDLSLMNIHGLSIGMKAIHNDIAAGATIISFPDATTARLNTAVTVASDEVINFKADNLQVKTRVLDENTGNVKELDDATGFSATTLVGGIKELQTDVGNVSAVNLGTASSDIATAIKEIVDGTGQAAVTVNAAGTGGTSIARNAANGGFLKKVKAGHGADAQTIVSNINFSAAGTSGNDNKTTLKFGQNTVLDVSDATLITENADADFDLTASKIVFGSTINDGQGLEINRTSISGVVGNTADIKPSVLWIDGEVSARNDATSTVTATTSGSTSSGSTTMNFVSAAGIVVGTVMTSDTAGIADGTFVSAKSSNTITLSKATTQTIASGTVVSFNVHSRNDLAWNIKGFKPTSTPDNANSFYQAPNLDFYNAGRLFGKGTSGINSTQTGVTVTWDPVNQHFDATLQNSGVTAGTTGSSTLVPVITVDAFGRITAVTTADVANSLGTFTLGDGSTTQSIGVSKTVTIAGTNNEIETALTESGGVNTITVGLPNDVTIGNDLTVTDRLIVNGTGPTEHSTFAGNVDVAGDLAVTGSITAGGSSLGFTTTSATVSSKQIILNALAGSTIADIASGTGQALVPSASFVAHRGFKSDVISGAVGTLTKGLRYRIISTASSNAITASEQTALKAISGNTDNLSHEEVITAVTTGHATIGSSATITLREQEVEAKIAWNEGTDQWELYRASATTTGAIVAQGDTFNGTLHASTLVTPSTNTDDENKELSFVDVSGSTSTLQKNSGLLYNPSAKHLKVAGAIGIGLTGNPDGTVPFTPEGMLHIKTNVNGKDAKLILESDHDNDSETSNAVIELHQDGRRVFGGLRLTGEASDRATNSTRNTLLLEAAAQSPGPAGDNGNIQFATGGVITVGSSSSTITVNGTSAWKTFNNVFLKTAQGGQGAPVSYGGFEGASVAGQKVTFNDGAGTISLAPNTSVYSTGSLHDGNPDNVIATDGGSGAAGDGGAFIHFNTFLEDSTWNGRTLTFSGSVDGYTIDNRYVAEVFIKYLLKTGNNYAEGETVGANLKASVGDLDANGNFSLTLAIPAVGDPSIGSATPVPQIGFVVKGVNANSLNAFASGDIDISSLSATVSAPEDADQASGNPTITSDPSVRMTISNTGNVGVATTAPGAKLDVHGNFRVEGDQSSKFLITSGGGSVDDDLAHTAVFASNNLSQANTLSDVAGDRLKQAVFVSRPGYGGRLSYLDIVDVRITDDNDEATGSAKRIQARSSTSQTAQGDLRGFISFPGNSNKVEIGGIHTSVDKVGVRVNSDGATELFHNTADANASSKKLETTTGGIAVTGHLSSTTAKIGGLKIADSVSDDHPTYPVYGNYIAFKGTSGDQYGNYNHTYIGERIYGADGGDDDTRPDGEKSELLFMKLNDTESAGGGSDRIRHFASNHVFDISTSTVLGAVDGDLESALNATNRTSFSAMTIRQSGKVGIGTDSPTDLLTLSAPMAATPTYIAIRQNHDVSGNVSGGGAGIIFDTSASNDDAGKYLAKIEGIRAQANHASNELRFFTTWQTEANATELPGQSDNPQQRMVIDQQGNVGIGTNTPDQAFHAQTEADITAGVNRQKYPTLDVAGRVKATHIDSATIDTTGNIRIGHGTMDGALFVHEINAVDAGVADNNHRHIYINAGESWALGAAQNAKRLAAQTSEKVYINAEYGLEVTSHPNNWTASLNGEVAAGWDGKNNPVKINQQDGSSQFNQIQHTGLTMTSGTDIDQLYTLDFTPPTDNEWTDIGINGSNLSAGTYIVQLYIYEGNGGQYNETYSGIMTWFNGNTNDDNSDEIFLHNAGHASNAASVPSEGTKNWYLRTLRTLSADTNDLKLQVRSSYTPPTGNENMVYRIKLRRMI